MTPSGLNRLQVQRLLAEAKHVRGIADRIENFSGSLLDCPYKPFPLVGSAGTPEVFTASLDGFDCVTFIETVLALAHATTVDGFIAWLRKIRYAHGRIEWKTRNHYMTGWIRNNLRNGTVRRIRPASVPTVLRKRVLNIVSGLPSRRTVLKCIPKRAVPRLSGQLLTGDLIFFASTRNHLDFFHAGIIVRRAERLLLRHASRSQGGVVEQPLADFLRKNRMAGVVVMRPAPGAMRSGK